MTTSYSGSSKFGETLGYDAQGLISSRTDTVNGVASPTKTYQYDGSNRLWKSTVSGATTTYGYDAHSNLRTINGAVVATYDVEDRLISFGNPAITFSHTSGTGERLTRTLNGQVTHYVYDSFHGLIQVRLPTAVTLDYTIDALGRRVTRKRLVNGVLQNEKRYLYAEGNRLVAELNSSGAVVSQFIYARGAHVPDILIKGTTVYQMVTDHLGSVRLVVQMSNGAIAQRIDYDDWGTPTYVTGTPDLQPFAFAGGHWDPDTKLLHLGAREYDPEVRRFLTRDPSGFAGGWNLYGYAGNDPVNYVDPDGNTPWLAAAAVGAASSAVTEIALQLATNGGNFDCIDWGYVGVSAAIGALPGVGKGLNWRALLANQRGALFPKISVTPSEALRIQNAANRIGKPIHLVGSRAKGTAKPWSDYDFVVQANSATRRSVAKSLPGAKDIKRGLPWNQDIYQELDSTLPHVTFFPK